MRFSLCLAFFIFNLFFHSNASLAWWFCGEEDGGVLEIDPTINYEKFHYNLGDRTFEGDFWESVSTEQGRLQIILQPGEEGADHIANMVDTITGLFCLIGADYRLVQTEDYEDGENNKKVKLPCFALNFYYIFDKKNFDELRGKGSSARVEELRQNLCALMCILAKESSSSEFCEQLTAEVKRFQEEMQQKLEEAVMGL